MIQRALPIEGEDEDPAAGKWEFPGGCREEGESPWDAALREWQEEMRRKLVEYEGPTGSWDCGKYVGFIVTVDRESDIPISDGEFNVVNPDDLDGDRIEVAAWWNPADLPDCNVVRDELVEEIDKFLSALETVPAYLTHCILNDKTHEMRALQLQSDGTLAFTGPVLGLTFAKFNPNQPRDDNGRWVSSGRVAEAVGSIEKAAKLFQGVSRPEERAKLVKFLEEKGMDPAKAAAAEKAQTVHELRSPTADPPKSLAHTVVQPEGYSSGSPPPPTTADAMIPSAIASAHKSIADKQPLTALNTLDRNLRALRAHGVPEEHLVEMRQLRNQIVDRHNVADEYRRKILNGLIYIPPEKRALIYAEVEKGQFDAVQGYVYTPRTAEAAKMPAAAPPAPVAEPAKPLPAGVGGERDLRKLVFNPQALPGVAKRHDAPAHKWYATRVQLTEAAVTRGDYGRAQRYADDTIEQLAAAGAHPEALARMGEIRESIKSKAEVAAANGKIVNTPVPKPATVSPAANRSVDAGVKAGPVATAGALASHRDEIVKAGYTEGAVDQAIAVLSGNKIPPAPDSGHTVPTYRSVANATTLRAVESFMSKQDVAFSGSDKRGEQFTLPVAKSIANTTAKCREMFPFVRVVSVSARELRNEACAVASITDGGVSIQFTTRLAKGDPKYLAGLKRDAKAKFTVGGTVESVMAHEFGHAIKEQIADFPTITWLKENLPKRGDLSKYGQTNLDEAFAEGVAAIVTVPEKQWTPWMVKFRDQLKMAVPKGGKFRYGTWATNMTLMRDPAMVIWELGYDNPDVPNPYAGVEAAFFLAGQTERRSDDGEGVPSGDLDPNAPKSFAKFDPNQPRGDNGRWIASGKVEAAALSGSIEKAAELFGGVSNPEQRAKLVKFLQAKGMSEADAMAAEKADVQKRSGSAAAETVPQGPPPARIPEDPRWKQTQQVNAVRMTHRTDAGDAIRADGFRMDGGGNAMYGHGAYFSDSPVSEKYGKEVMDVTLKPHNQLVLESDGDVPDAYQRVAGVSYLASNARQKMVDAGIGSLRFKVDDDTYTVVLDPSLIQTSGGAGAKKFVAEGESWGEFGSGKVPRPGVGIIDSPLPPTDLPILEATKRARLSGALENAAKDGTVDVRQLTSWQTMLDKPESLAPVDVATMPPLDVVKVGGRTILMDGNHRASSLFAQGVEQAPAKIVDLDDPANAKLVNWAMLAKHGVTPKPAEAPATAPAAEPTGGQYRELKAIASFEPQGLPGIARRHDAPPDKWYKVRVQLAKDAMARGDKARALAYADDTIKQLKAHGAHDEALTAIRAVQAEAGGSPASPSPAPVPVAAPSPAEPETRAPSPPVAESPKPETRAPSPAPEAPATVPTEHLVREYQRAREMMKLKVRANEMDDEIRDEEDFGTRQALVAQQKTIRNAVDRARWDAATMASARNATNPQEFIAARAAVAERVADERAKRAKLVEDLLAAGVRPKKGDSRRNIDLYQMRDDAHDWGGGGYTLEKASEVYDGLTPELWARVATLDNRSTEYYDDSAAKPYYGEPVEVRPLGKKLGEVHPVVAALKVRRGGADEATKRFMADADVNIQMDPKILGKFITDGEFKSVFEGGKGGVTDGRKGSKRSDYLRVRKEGEQRLFGIPTEDDGQRPIYGYLEHPDRSKGQGGGMADQYGAVQLVFHESVKERTTYTPGDSLDDRRMGGFAAPVNDPANWSKVQTQGYFSFEEDAAKNPVTANAGPSTEDWRVEVTTNAGQDVEVLTPRYIEAQIHGGLRLQDVKEIRVPVGFKLTPAMSKRLKESGVQVTVIPPPMKHIFYSDPPEWDQALDDKDA